MRISKFLEVSILSLVAFTGLQVAEAKVVRYDIVVREEDYTIRGKSIPSMTLNGKIPGPTLVFTEGDTAVIRVINQMDVSTSIHWHGILVPPEMDGVPYVSFPPIEAGDTFVYEFPIRQSGTYWYHSHTGLQEQRGVYGAIVIHPRNGEKSHDYDREYVVVLSDWIFENPHEVLRTLKAGREWYPVKKNRMQNLFDAMRVGRLSHFLKRELMRMPPMDISDVAYDHFLTNGKPEDTLPASPGERIRLRIVNASAGTNFLIDFSGGPMEVISADGIDVEPFSIDRLFIAIAETYDVIVEIPSSGQFQLRATAQDNSGSTSLWIGNGKRIYAPPIPEPDLYYTMGKVTLKKLFAFRPQDAMGMSDSDVESGKFDSPGMMGMKSMGRKMSMSRNRMAIDGMDPRRPWSPYGKLVAKTEWKPDSTKIRTIRLTLDGDMERYVWMMNGKPLSASDSIHIRKGEVVRFVLINRTMMHHPMHLHGHFFRVITKNGSRSPWKHTVDVPPMSTVVIEFPANEVGDWFFHCHLLYHMKSGMARVVHYEEYTPPEDVREIRRLLYRDSWYHWAEANIWSNGTSGHLNTSNTFYDVQLEWKASWSHPDSIRYADTEFHLKARRYIDRFRGIFLGLYAPGTGGNIERVRGYIGADYLLPMNIRLFAWLDSEGGYRVGLSKHIPVLPRITMEAEVEYDRWQGLDYTIAGYYILTRRLWLTGNIDSESGAGIGINLWF